ncbi:MAG: chromosomal replication initiator protein DnaA [Ignavibacteria bacterium]|nr:chromosomal replication initiator protein DnaA [Ignavibacteria bacterium]
MELVSLPLMNITFESNNFSNYTTDIWKQCLETIRPIVSSKNFSLWLEQIVPLSFDSQKNSFSLQVPSQFFSDWVDERFGNLLKSTLSDILSKSVDIEYSIKKEESENSVALSEEKEPSFFSPPKTPSEQSSNPLNKFPSVFTNGQAQPAVSNTFNPRFTFDNFIKGDSNKFAYAAAAAVANKTGGTEFNPFVLYGGSGLGKTHLIQAIGNFVLSHQKARRILYITSEEFTKNFVESIQHEKTIEFTNFYRSLDVLIVDDIQFFGGEKTLDYFFHTFNSLYQDGKQIILSSDRSPKEIKGINERLITRFQMGITADVQPPDLEMRIAILLKKSDALGVRLPLDVAELLAQNISTNVRQLEGCLHNLIAKSSFENQTISLELAKDVLRTVVGGIKSVVTIQDIQRVVSTYYNIPQDLLSQKTRKQEIVFARQVAMFLAKELTNSTFLTIGLHFGGRDHSTVVHSYQTIEELFLKDENIQNDIRNIKSRLQFVERK